MLLQRNIKLNLEKRLKANAELYIRTLNHRTNEKVSQMHEKIAVPMRKYAFYIVLLILFTLPIILLMTFDYFNIESFPPSPFEGTFNQKFVFEETWKGRMFYLFFLWLLLLESLIDKEKIVRKQPKNRIRLLAFFACAIFPTIYVLSVNLLGGGYSIVTFGRDLGIVSGFEYFHWPLSLEYLVLTISFFIATILAYKKNGLSVFSIALALMAGITTFYMIDTIYPFGVFKPIQLLSLPTAGVASAFCEILGYRTTLSYPTVFEGGYFPKITIRTGTKSASALIGWPCAGVHSMFLFILIILVFFKKSEMSSFRKSIYFILGALGTYMINVLRIYSYLIIALNDAVAAKTFHDMYGELYFFSWISLYIVLIICIQRFMLVEKTRHAISKIGSYLRL